MSINVAQFPGQLWDGLSPNTQRVSREDNQAPRFEDWDQIVAELRATQQFAIDLEMGEVDTTWLNIGNATDAVAVGDLAAGDAASGGFFYDASASLLTVPVITVGPNTSPLTLGEEGEYTGSSGRAIKGGNAAPASNGTGISIELYAGWGDGTGNCGYIDLWPGYSGDSLVGAAEGIYLTGGYAGGEAEDPSGTGDGGPIQIVGGAAGKAGGAYSGGTITLRGGNGRTGGTGGNVEIEGGVASGGAAGWVIVYPGVGSSNTGIQFRGVTESIEFQWRTLMGITTAFAPGAVTGSLSESFGHTASAQGDRSVTYGYGAECDGDDSIVVGYLARNDADDNVVIGANAQITNAGFTGNILVGSNTQCFADQCVVLGRLSIGRNNDDIVIGYDADGPGIIIGARTDNPDANRCIAIGDDITPNEYSILIGDDISVTTPDTIYIGFNTPQGSNGRIGIGSGVINLGSRAVAIGGNAGGVAVDDTTYVAIGESVTCDSFNIAIGSNLTVSGTRNVVFNPDRDVSGTSITGNDNVVIGYDTNCAGDQHILIGHGSSIASGISSHCIMIGTGSQHPGGDNRVIIGTDVVGHSTVDDSVAFGSDSSPFTLFALGEGDMTFTDKPATVTLRTSRIRAGSSETDIGGGDFNIASGPGVGDGTLSAITFQTPNLVGTGNTQQTLDTRLTIATAAVTSAVPFGLASYTVAGLPSAATAGQMIYVSDETGGAVPAFSDGTNWRRVTDRAIVS